MITTPGKELVEFGMISRDKAMEKRSLILSRGENISDYEIALDVRDREFVGPYNHYCGFEIVYDEHGFNYIRKRRSK